MNDRQPCDHRIAYDEHPDDGQFERPSPLISEMTPAVKAFAKVARRIKREAKKDD